MILAFLILRSSGEPLFQPYLEESNVYNTVVLQYIPQNAYNIRRHNNSKNFTIKKCPN